MAVLGQSKMFFLLVFCILKYFDGFEKHDWIVSIIHLNHKQSHRRIVHSKMNE
jgi:hypothetical protein